MHDSDESDENEPDDRSNDGLGLGLGAGLRALREILLALEEGDRTFSSGTIERGGTTIDYGYTADSVADERPVREPRTQRPRKKRRLSNEIPTDVSRDDDTVVVTADLGGVDLEDVSIGTSGDTLVLAVDGRPVERIPIELPNATATETSVNNDVLVVRLEAGGDDDE